MTDTEGALLRPAQHLAYETEPIKGACQVTGFSGEGRCVEPSVALRWEMGFADWVCEEHARRARERGAMVVRPARADGTQTAVA